MTDCFVAYGHPRLPGEYAIFGVPSDIRAFVHEKGGFWSLVRGEHATLICCEVLKVGVVNWDRLSKDSKNPGSPSIGDDVIVVSPEEPFTEWADESVSDFTQGAHIPIPPCRVELWKRIR